MKAAETLANALNREAHRVEQLGYTERARELRSRAGDVQSAATLLASTQREIGNLPGAISRRPR